MQIIRSCRISKQWLSGSMAAWHPEERLSLHIFFSVFQFALTWSYLLWGLSHVLLSLVYQRNSVWYEEKTVGVREREEGKRDKKRDK
jgi:D-alanyl-lipoteichoic acid acyltransferase DltB (MBOAT superfamily)